MPKKEVVQVQPRQYSRRAASKEALKQMQILLDEDSDDEPLKVPSDDDVSLVAIESPPPPPPPKKKYKLSHRKSSDGHDRDVIVLKSITNHNVENNLDLECWHEELSPEQLARKNKAKDDEAVLQKKLEELINNTNAQVIYKGEFATAIEFGEQIQKTIKETANATPTSIILNNNLNAPPGQSYQLVLDPRLGMIVGAVANTSASSPTAPSPTPSKVYPQGKVQVAQNLKAPPQTTPPNRQMRTRRSGSGIRHPAPPITPPALPVAAKQTPKFNITKPPPLSKLTVKAPGRGRPPSNQYASTVRPAESNVEGGLTMGRGQQTKSVVDLTTTDENRADCREVSFNKLQGKTYPSLVVVARPYLRASDVNTDRAKLDAKVKAVLMHAPTKFTEWLIQQGLVRSEQKCSVHVATMLKLGMYSDVSKFPYSGGYVWISECCPQKFVSVFSGSLFEGSPHPPTVILKLLYHWSCQTNIQNVTQWVKVDNLYVKGVFTWLRSVCTVALQTHVKMLGGPGLKVEVGVISLGTTSQDGNQRQVKVEVLGVLERDSKLIRLRAVEPLADGDRNYKKRFSKILEPILQWVHPASIIVTDLTVDKGTLHGMGFLNVVQNTCNEFGGTNRTIMEYLRKIVPRMFQNTLSLLSRQIIQQFLDELVWREWYGTNSLQAFENIVNHLSEQTRYDLQTSLIIRLNKVALNPFKNWSLALFSNAPSNSNSKPTTSGATSSTDPSKRYRNRKPTPTQSATTTLDVNRPPKSNSPDVPEQMVPLENYYYGTIDHYASSTNVILNMKCPFCKISFNNNIQLMSHLFKHAHNANNESHLCRYCLTSVPNVTDLDKHIATAHPCETKFDNGFVCLICETHYMNPFILGKHMSKEHCPSELPYQCGTCGYRCSNHKQAIDHFYKHHDNGSTIQCPFCLKSTTVYSSQRNIVQNVNYFIQHLQKHQRKQFARRCGKCNLWFVQKDILKDHQAKMHVSQRGKQGLIPWTAPRNGVMVPKSKMDQYPCDAEVINFGTLTLNVSKSSLCKECDAPMDKPKHFPSFESCQNPNCQYSTCCSNAMQEHNAKCNKNQNRTPPEEPLPYEMFCVCGGFSSTDGNLMAKHLAICERKSAYPSVECAKAAIVTHSMLDVLGLVRKPDETVSVEPEKKSDETETIEAEEDVTSKTEIVVEETNEEKTDDNESAPTTTEEVESVSEEPEKSDDVSSDPQDVEMNEISQEVSTPMETD